MTNAHERTANEPERTLVGFLLARIAEEEKAARECPPWPWRVATIDDEAAAHDEFTWAGESVVASDGIVVAEPRALSGPQTRAVRDHIARHDPARVLAECEAKRRIIEWHQNWPVLTQTPPTFEPVDSTEPSSLAFRASQQIAWLTEQEYRERFGDEPPTSPILAMLAVPYAGHPDYREEWKP